MVAPNDTVSVGGTDDRRTDLDDHEVVRDGLVEDPGSEAGLEGRR